MARKRWGRRGYKSGFRYRSNSVLRPVGDYIDGSATDDKALLTLIETPANWGANRKQTYRAYQHLAGVPMKKILRKDRYNNFREALAGDEAAWTAYLATLV